MGQQKVKEGGGRSGGEWHADWRVLVLLIGCGIAVFGASANDGFHFDDELILEDSNVTSPERWSHFLNPLRLRQVTFFSFYLNHRIGGEDPVGYHLANIGLHTANGMLLYVLLGPILGGWIAAGAALIFLVHPVQTEAVLYVYQRSTLLAAFFSLCALRVARSAGADSGRRWRSRVAGVVLLFGLAAWSKESALAVPLVLVLLAGVRSRLGRFVLAGVGAGVVFALALLLWLGEETVGVGAASGVGAGTYFLTETRVLYTYLRLLFVPYPQALEYEVMPASSVGEPAVAAALAGLALMVWATVRLTRSGRFRWAGIGAASFFLLLLPTSGFIPSQDFAFEHRLYLPLLGFAVFAACWLARLPHRSAVLAILVVLWGGLSINRGRVWASDVSLWEDTVEKAPGKARAWFNLGGAYMEAEDPRARQAFLQVLELEPGFTEAFYDLGVIEQRAGNDIAALGWYERALDAAPDYWPAWNNLGNVRMGFQDHGGALAAYERTLALNPDYWPVRFNMAIVYRTTNRPDLAVPQLRTVLDWDPEFSEARYLLAVSLEQLGQTLDARREFDYLEEAERESLGAIGGPGPLPADSYR